MGLGFAGQFFLYGIAICILVLCYAIVRLVSIHARLDSSVRTKLADLVERVENFEQRLTMIQGHALDYINSISGDGSRALYKLQRILATQREIIGRIQVFVERQDVDSLRQAEFILADTLSRAYIKQGTAPQNSVLDNWEAHTEELIQLLGFDISLASKSSHDSGMPKKRTRRPTSLSLKEAGILAALRGEKEGK